MNYCFNLLLYIYVLMLLGSLNWSEAGIHHHEEVYVFRGDEFLADAIQRFDEVWLEADGPTSPRVIEMPTRQHAATSAGLLLLFVLLVSSPGLWLRAGLLFVMLLLLRVRQLSTISWFLDCLVSLPLVSDSMI